MATKFAGFPADAFTFYADLELDNSKEFWADNKARYEASVAAPMHELLDELEPEFGAGRLFRPYRDVRFSADKSPYKEHQGGYVQAGPACGYYVQVSSAGLMVGAGWYDSSSEQVARYRTAIDEGITVPDLRAILAGLRRTDLELGGDVLKTKPRDIAADHPDLDLLRHRTVLVSATYPYDEAWLGSRKAFTKVRTAWRRAHPLVDWLADNVTGRTPG